MNLTFKELRCPKCGSELSQGSITHGVDVSMVKRCSDHELHGGECDFWMIIVIPHNDYDYTVNREIKKEQSHS